MFDDEMLTIEDLAAYLKLKPQTIYKWAQSGKVPGAKFGKEWRFRRSTIEAWIDSHMNAQQPTTESHSSASECRELSGSSNKQAPRASRRKNRVPSGNGNTDPTEEPAAQRGLPEPDHSESGHLGSGNLEIRESDGRDLDGRGRRRGASRRGSRSRSEGRKVLEERGPEKN